MKTMKWLFQREMWEHKGALLWTPAVIASLIGVLLLLAMLLGQNIQFDSDGEAYTIGTIAIEGGARTRLVATLAQAYMAPATPLLGLLGVLVFFYCLGALHDERRDRSLLFWKSLPVSDLETVASKALMALLVAPLIVIAIDIALSLVLLVAACLLLLAHGTNVFGVLLTTPDVYLTPLRLIGLLPVYMLWALPTVGWLLMVSSMARSKVFLWAVGVPVVVTLLLALAEKSLHFGFNAGWFFSHVVARLLLGVLPGSWLGVSHGMSLEEAQGMNGPASVFVDSWHMLGGVQVWIGVLAGLAMLAVAVWMRRRREEG